MNPDDFKQAWQSQSSQPRLTIDAELLLKEVRRNQQYFTAMIIWRDLREAGVALLMVPLWIYLGMKFSIPWTWYLTLPAVLWIAGYMLADLMRHGRQPPELGEPIRQRVERCLAQVEHQIWLLRNVFWWYLLPIAVALLAFLGHCAWLERAWGWLTALSLALMIALMVIVFAAIYWLNQYAVRSELQPRRQELETLLASLQDETLP